MHQPSRRDVLKTAPLGLVPVAGCLDGGTTPTETATPTDTETDTPTQPSQASTVVGDAVAGGRLSMVVDGTSTTKSLGPHQQAGDGRTYAVARLTVKNTTENAYTGVGAFSTAMLTDGDGTTYDASTSASDAIFQHGLLAPGELASGIVAFDVPESADEFTLQFDLSEFAFTDHDRVTVDLTTEVDQHDNLTQSLHIPVYSPGDTVARGGVGVTVHGVEITDSIGDSQPPKDHEYAVVDLTTANDTDGAVDIETILAMQLKDRTGREFDVAVSATGELSNSYSSGELAAGSEIRGKIAYELPVTAPPLYFVLDYSTVSHESKAFWEVS